ncbi:Ppx/GppA phosphatase family protein [Chthonobacter rhizosphaerae]|uniref:Ppx/GppA phosphatase family protein n=1 Tax=Chthonobacter rhizosphaerae TaxID=2735553 RepID=UPI0031B57B72
MRQPSHGSDGDGARRRDGDRRRSQPPRDRRPDDRRPDDHAPDRHPAGRHAAERHPPDRAAPPAIEADRRPPRRAPRGNPVYAALDLGTNNCRLLIAEPQERGFRVVDAFSRIVRLGEGIGRSGRLSDAAMDRAVEALAVCREKMGDFNVRRMRLIATEACRAAENGPIFLERVRHETGLSLEIVNRETEARLAVAGCATLVDPRADGVLLFDIGGGSSELVWLDLRRRGDAKGFALTRFIKAWTSLPVGVVTLSERHGGVSVTPGVFEDMVAEVAEMAEAFPDAAEIGPLIAAGRVHLLGTSGTVTTLAGMHLGLKRYDRRRVDGVWLSAGDIDAMIDRLISMEFADRVSNPCIGADRADLVLAGCAILEAIRRRWPCDRLRVADRGLREGILVELMARDGVWRRRPPAPARAPAPAAT